MKDFTSGSVPRLMMAFMVPLLLSNLLQAVYVLIDAIWAGRLIGPAGVAIVATGMPVMFLLSSLIAGIVIGASILAGQAFGAQNRALLSDIVSTSVLATVALAAGISVLGVLFCGPLLRLINTPAPLYRDAHVFLALIIAGMTLGVLGQWFAAMMNAAGDSRTPFKVLLITLLINAALAPLLITGGGLLPPLGVAGSALATITANVIGAVICLFVWRSHHLSDIAPFRWQVHWDTLRRIVAIGFPLSLQMLIVSSSFLFILSLANRFGPDVTAAFGIGSRIDQFAFLAIFAVTAAISAMTAQNIGAGRLDRIREITRWGILFSLGMSVFFCALVMLFPDAITRLFTGDPRVVALCRHYFRLAGASYIALALTFAYQGVLRGAGDTIPSFLMIASTMIFLRVPLCFILSHYTPLRETGLWAGITLSAFAGAAAFYFYYAGGRWKQRAENLPGPAADAAPSWAPDTLQPEELR